MGKITKIGYATQTAIVFFLLHLFLFRIPFLLELTQVHIFSWISKIISLACVNVILVVYMHLTFLMGLVFLNERIDD